MNPEPETESAIIGPKSPKRWWRRILLGFVVFIGIAVLAYRVWYHHTFPYGWSHACSKGLGMGLNLYAADHDGWLPHGEATPEASLSLLYGFDTNTALWVLAGKKIPHETVAAILSTNRTLPPNACGWHYVEGLRDGDDPQIAVAWDKVVGLGHNGERKPDIMHEIVLLDGSSSYISKREWPQFIAEEKKRLDEVMKSRDTNAPPIRWSDEESLGPNHPLRK